MAEKATQPPAAASSGGALGSAPAEPPGAREITGPLSLERLTKDDGRSLILYAARDEQR